MLLSKLNNYCLLMRLNNSIGTQLVLWPTFWAVWLASKGAPSFQIVIIFFLGGLVMRSAGCIINDYIDRNHDGFVTRTKNRALVTGKVSTCEAICLLVILLSIALFLALQLPLQVMKYAGICLSLVCIYPFLKRYTNMVQFFLGVTFSFGVLIAFVAQCGQVTYQGWILYFATIIWVVAYDTIYAMMDKKDDLNCGIYSSAILFGEYARFWVSVLQICVIGILIWFGISQRLGVYYLTCIGLASIYFIYQQMLIRKNNTIKYLTAFRNNSWFGLIVFIAFVFADYTHAIVIH